MYIVVTAPVALSFLQHAIDDLHSVAEGDLQGLKAAALKHCTVLVLP